MQPFHIGDARGPMAESAFLGMVIYTSEQGPGSLPPTAPATMVSPAAITPTITTVSIPSGVSTEDVLAVLYTRLGAGRRQMPHQGAFTANH